VVGAGWLYVLVDAGKAGGSIVTLLVDDLDERLADLAARDVETGPLREIPHAVRSVWITDPDGNRIQIGQPLAPEGRA
jgi:catechol 2,3-dioxygenase-like lactoylglutathione lyase family enzyme